MSEESGVVSAGTSSDERLIPDLPLSPELVLVDPDLARWARERLQETGRAAEHPEPAASLRAATLTAATSSNEEHRLRSATNGGLDRDALAVSFADSQRPQETKASNKQSPAQVAAPHKAAARTLEPVAASQPPIRRRREYGIALRAALLLTVLAAIASIPAAQPKLRAYADADPITISPRSGDSTSSTPRRADRLTRRRPGQAKARANRESGTAAPNRTRPSAVKRPKPKTQRENVSRSRDASQPAARNAPATSRRFVWVPVSGARAYDVALYRGQKLIFVRRTTNAVLELPRRWRHAGRWVSLQPGGYRWYVWVVNDEGRRASSAVVQARLVIPGD
jgi:hypothetical protein